MAKRKSKSQLPDTLFEAKEKTQPRKPVAKRRFKWWQLLGVGMLGLCACSWLLTTLNIIPDTQERAATQTVAALAAGDIAPNVNIVAVTNTPAAALTENPIFTPVPATNTPTPVINTPIPASTSIPATATPIPPTITSVPTTAPLVSTTNITPLSPAQTFYTTGRANIRECPNTSCSVIQEFAMNTTIVANAIAVGQEVNPGNANWYRFDYQGREAYVYSGVVSSTPPAVQNPPVASSGGQTTTSSQPVTSGGQSQSPTLAGCTVTVANSGQPWNCGGDIYNCPNFCTYSDVQSYWNACPGNPSRLDGDNDGTPCDPTNWR